MISKLLFQLSRNDVVGWLVRWGFANLSGLLPVKRISETETVLVFYHPRPFWNTHILLVPKAPIASIMSLKQTDCMLISEILELAQRTAKNLELDRVGFSLLVNGGAYQDVAQLHFHLASETSEMHYACHQETTDSDLLIDTELLQACFHPQPSRSIHIVLRPKIGLDSMLMLSGVHSAYIEAVITSSQQLVREMSLMPTGFTLVASVNPNVPYSGSCFHLVSGDELHRMT